MRRLTIVGGLAAGLTFGAGAAAETLVLQNDGFVTDGEVAFQEGFAAGEEGAAVLGPLDTAFTLRKIRFLFGTTGTETVELIVYEDLGTSGPGQVLYTSPYEVTGSADAMYEIDVSASEIVVAAGASVRVSFRFEHAGLPSIARDSDGATAGRNWIHSVDGDWLDAAAVGVAGDWVIRAEVETGEGSGAGATASSSSAMGCAPNDTRSCVHVSGCTGVETCTSDGLAWGACVCKATGEGGAGGGDVAATDDEGGCALAAPEHGAGWSAWLSAAALCAALARRRSVGRFRPGAGRSRRAACSCTGVHSARRHDEIDPLQAEIDPPTAT